MLASVSVGVGALAACAPRSTALLATANVFWVKQHTYIFLKNTTGCFTLQEAETFSEVTDQEKSVLR